MATAAVLINTAGTGSTNAQASGGMAAFGDAILFVAVFAVCALVPTGAGLFFLRPYPRFWNMFSTGGLVVAFTSVVAAILFTVGRHETHSPLSPWVDLSVLRILVAPLFALTFLVCAVLSPQRSQRFSFLAATAMEAIVGLYGGFVWAAPLFLRT